MALHKLFKKISGKKEVLDSIDTLPIINRRKEQLKGRNITLRVVPADEDDAKYRKPLTDGSWRGGDYHLHKHKNKAKIKRAKRKNG